MSKFLKAMGYEVYFQEFKAAYEYVIFVDSPKMAIKTYEDFFRQVFKRLGLEVGREDLKVREILQGVQEDRTLPRCT